MRFILSLFILLASASTATALVAAMPDDQAHSQFVCDPAQFSFAQAPGGWLLDGALEMPTPGYSYTVTKEESGDVIRANIVLSVPDGPALTVISTLPIRHVFSGGNGVNGLEVTLEKKFDWGPSAITCKRRE